MNRSTTQTMRSSGRATMNDVAARAGVSLKTVSRVVNGEPGVLPATAERVARAIADLGFRRNDSARQLRTGRAAGIGLILEDVADPFYSVLTRAVEQVVRDNDCLLLTGSCDDDPDREQELAMALCERRVDGLVMVPAATDHSYLAHEIKAGVPVVFVDRPPINLAADVVLVDNVGGVRDGVRHLINGGHRRIAYLGDDLAIFTARERLTGYRSALAAAGIPLDEGLVVMGKAEPVAVRAALDKLLSQPNAATALFCGNNRLTTAVLRELAGRVDRPALVGFDDFELADLISPGLTVVAQDPAGLGRVAATLLFDRLAGLSDAPRRVVLPTVLIPRGSGEVPPRT
ncbi:MAG TPA: LacI family DNA-binding transcriptional regulator [Actinospica sp.]|nr:LacI family DNA-binding transcriptional regulator [Actinospica sp.]